MSSGTQENPRLADEYRLAGGEKVIQELIGEAEQRIWETQAVVLSYVRENGNKYDACDKGGITRMTLSEWEDDDTLDWRKRRADAEAEAISRVRTIVFRRVESGEIKSPSAALLQFLHETTAPDVYARKTASEERYDPFAVYNKHMENYRRNEGNRYGEDEVEVEVQRRLAQRLLEMELEAAK